MPSAAQAKRKVALVSDFSERQFLFAWLLFLRDIDTGHPGEARNLLADETWE